MLAPGASSESTNSALTGSETAEKTTGVWLSSVAACMAMATGVAIPTIRSTLSAWKLEIIWFITAASPLGLSYSTWKVTPFSSLISSRRAWIFSLIWFREASSTKLQIPMW